MASEEPTDPQEGDGRFSPTPLTTLTTFQLNRMLDIQVQELEIRTSELQLGKQKDENAFKFGMRALEVQGKDRQQAREHASRQRICTYTFASITTAGVLLLLAYALHTKNAAFATELEKDIVLLLSGGAGGFGISEARKKRPPDKNAQE